MKTVTWTDGHGQKQTADLHKDGKHIVLLSDVWYMRYRDVNGITRRETTGCRDKENAEAVLKEKTKTIEDIKKGLVPESKVAAEGHAKQPIRIHIDAYLKDLAKKCKRKGGRRTSQTHLKNVECQLNRLVADCRIHYLRDISREAIEDWIEKREDESDMAGRTINTYLSALRAFCKWALGENRLLVNPLKKLGTADEDEKRRMRRSLNEDEIRRLLDVARTRPLIEAQTIRSGPRKGQLGAKVSPERREKFIKVGIERDLIYRGFINTGARLNDFVTLTVDDVHLNTPRPYVNLKAANTKENRDCCLPLRQDYAEDLRNWLNDKLSEYQQRTLIDGRKELPDALPSDMKVFNVPRTMRQVLYRDLAFAGIQAVDEKGRPMADDQGRKVDIHALRKTTGSLMARAGVKPQEVTKMLRHSSQAITWKHYTDLELIDDHRAVNMLPDFNSGRDRESGKKTGTDDTVLKTGNDGVQIGAQPTALCDNSCQSRDNMDKGAENHPATQTAESGLSDKTCQEKSNARDWSRTSTTRRSLAPQASASAYSATRAY